MSIETRTAEALICSLQCNDKGSVVCAGTENGTITVYKIEEDGVLPIQNLAHGSSPIFSTLFMDDRIVAGTHDGHLLVWRLNQTEYVFESAITVFQGCINTIYECKGSVVCGCSDGRIRKVSLSGEVAAEWFAHKHGVTGVSVYKNYIVSAGMDSVIKIWKEEDQSLAAELKEHSKAIRDCRICENPFDVFVIASCSDDGTLCLFTEEKIGSLEFTVDKHVIGTPCRKIAWSRLDHSVAVGYGQGEVKVFSPDSICKWKESSSVLP
ncbi:hypothetical protein NERG_00454 [Nematocida ausubeli]|uniref:WD repeat-containing protein JIP5 n=1 Tax=Nematocida ausubeli (strain ATCC PRA-371 / ERTm2) TaxID=1913371 RepID=H8ZA33_NEMA1|nr:hypothetical protein NERG_00454 [Nematocida ausubeli]